MRIEAPAATSRERIVSATPREHVPWLPSGARFVSEESRDALLEEAARCRFVVVDVAADGSTSLRDAIEEGIEQVLARRGTLPPQTPVGASAAFVVRDQHARLRASAARGLLLALPPMARFEEDGALAVDDGITLRSWLELAQDDATPTVVVAVREEDRVVPILVPRPLGAVVDEAEDRADRRPMRASRVVPALAPTALPPPVVRATSPASVDRDALLVALETSAPPSEARESVASEATRVVEPAEPMPMPALSLAPPSEAIDPESPSRRDRDDDRWDVDDVIAARATPALPPDLGPLDLEGAIDVADLPEPADHGAPPARPLRDLREVLDEALRFEAPASIPALTTPEPPPLVVHERVEGTPMAANVRERSAQRIANSAAWRAHAIKLEAARGPKPLAVVHELFETSYVPLLAAAARGELDAAVRGIMDEWRSSFAQSYLNAFASMKMTGKRPTMVLDAPELASKLGRATGAKSVRLLMVDGMSFDLGKRVASRLSAAMGSRASLAEQQILWSALPTTTPVQSFYLARGPNGLRDQEPPPSEPDISRGRNVSTLRRERIGSREILKLDLVEARLRTPGDGYDERLEAIAEETAQVIHRFAETLPARTLLYVFGDHGFVLPVGGSGFLTGPATQGGASPEEVLVGGFGWILDAVH